MKGNQAAEYLRRSSKKTRANTIDCTPIGFKQLLYLPFEDGKMELREAFAMALKALRQKTRRTQEDFYVASSRTYISTLERGLKSPTLDKIEDIAGVLGVHPASLVVSAYLHKDHKSLDELFQRIRIDLADEAS
jgi:hypothetical protein